MRNLNNAIRYVEDLLAGIKTVENLAECDDIIAGSYEMPGEIVGVIVDVNKEENFQFGCAHIITGHSEVQKIKVHRTNGSDVVALYKVLKGEGELYLNGHYRNIKTGDVIKLKNGAEYCMAGDMIVAEIFDPMFNEKTHYSTGFLNPLLDLTDNV